MEHLLYVGSLMCVWIIVSLAVNLVIGYTGMMAMGHAAYLGVGAYTAATLNIFLGVDYFSAMAAAALAGALVAGLTLLPLLRLGLRSSALGRSSKEEDSWWAHHCHEAIFR